MTPGHQHFATELTGLAAQISDPRLAMLAAGITAPLRVAVHGRRGVGRRTAAAALAATGLHIAEQADAADLTVHVVAEVVKPEDIAAVRAAREPVLVVLNKADLPGRGGAAMPIPVEPLSALFALAARPGGLDDPLWEALGRLASRPADLRSAEHFVSCPHPVPRATRERLCAGIDVSGVAALLGLAGQGGTAAQARALLGRLSNLDGVAARLAALGAAVYHRRMAEAVTRLAAMAVADDRIDDFLVRDATVAARLAAAAAAVAAPDEPVLARARRWQALRSAPVGAAQRACAADIARGSLRAWAATRGSV
ncbi:hypothetical protein AWC02_01410 [Mycolicibacter engbaekii]|uniref:Uncharacterized protein n=1 Tax=Mycolicibacter engbaekii TaxID=188915 RepID=A0A1X1UBT0_9MYCO|nr:hypothetical protein [Mycolicibacter engbaekii]ORV54129.1 hypothetical protein AWC02_01410 [Mycolicibacter engbaekii]